MAVQTKDVIKSYFLTGATPTQQQFHDQVDSYQDISDALSALVTAVNTGAPPFIIRFDGVDTAAPVAIGTFGQEFLSAETSASAQAKLGTIQIIYGGTGATTPAGAMTNFAAQPLQAGFQVVTFDLGNSGTGTVTPAFANGNAQKLTVNGSFTLAAPGGEGVLRIELTNDATGGYSITLTGFNYVTGGSYDATAATVQQVEIDTTGDEKKLTWGVPGVVA